MEIKECECKHYDGQSFVVEGICRNCGKPLPQAKECEHEWKFCCGGSMGGTSVNNDYICEKCGVVKKDLITETPKRIERMTTLKICNGYLMKETAEEMFDKINALIKVLNGEGK